jgi:hypothetical protein
MPKEPNLKKKGSFVAQIRAGYVIHQGEGEPALEGPCEVGLPAAQLFANLHKVDNYDEALEWLDMDPLKKQPSAEELAEQAIKHAQGRGASTGGGLSADQITALVTGIVKPLMEHVEKRTRDVAQSTVAEALADAGITAGRPADGAPRRAAKSEKAAR